MSFSDICIIGSSNIDFLIDSDNELKNDISVKGHIGVYPGGVARNIAVGLASFRQHLSLFTVLSKDILGNIIINSLDCDYINYDNSIVSKDSSFFCQISLKDCNIAVNDINNIDAIDEQYLKSHINVLEKSKLIVFDLNISIDSIEFLNLFSLNNGIKLFCDGTSSIKCNKISQFLKNIYMIKLNYCEAIELANCTLEKGVSEYLLIKKIQALGAQNICITLGKNGAILEYNNLIWKVSRNDFLNVSNAVGAGDFFYSALIYKFIVTNDWLESLVYANNISFYYLKFGRHYITSDIIMYAEKDDYSSVNIYKWETDKEQWSRISLKGIAQ